MSVADLEKTICATTPGRIMFQMCLADTHEEIQNLIEDGIDWAALQLTENAHLNQELGEDKITIDIVNMLKSLNFDAAHDTQIGGHCDIVVRAKNDFLWIGEAKVHSNYNWLHKGMAQLSTRYSTGVQGQDCGEILVYTYAPRLDKILAEWRDRVAESVEEISIEDLDRDRLIFRTTHPHVRTGRPFRVRHKGISLHFDPKA
ncbi:hypothetical protein ACFSE0_07555 [Ochrobactrum teleogrylli]|uniref:Restriction endonuclease n=2 Tax=Ochrobactrum teleogrylli TaxID=2479765 RepID=A0ABY2Y2P4_9HYPH|nr:hypothetical protein FIC94_16040 [[Ochrobactrum] teleogrylli]